MQFNAYPAMQTQLPDWGQTLGQLQSLQFNQQMQPYKLQEAQGLMDYRNLQMQQMQNNMENDLISQAMREGTDPQSWDSAMKRAKSLGAKTADQYLGQFTEKRRTDWLAARGGMPGNAPAGGGGGAGPANQLGGMSPSQQYDFNNMSPQQLQFGAQAIGRALSDLEAVRNSPNPAEQWEALKLQNPAYRNMGPYSPQILAQKYAEAQQNAMAIQSRLQNSGAGLPNPRNVPDVVGTPGTGISTIDPLAPGGPVVKEVQPPPRNDQLTGYDEGGYPIYHDPRSGKDTRGSIAIDKGRYLGGAGGGNSVFDRKRAAWLELHPGDNQGALDFASGRAEMTPAQRAQTARRMAQQEYQAQVYYGQQRIPDPDTWIRQRSQEIEQELNSRAQLGSPPAPGTPGFGPRPFAGSDTNSIAGVPPKGINIPINPPGIPPGVQRAPDGQYYRKRPDGRYERWVPD